MDSLINNHELKSNITPDQLLTLALDIGEKMISCGAEANRVEDTITRLCLAYGAIDVDVFSIPSHISATITTADLFHKTQTRRIYSYATDLDKLEYLNAISRHICGSTPAFNEIAESVKSLRPAKDFKWYIQLVGYLLASGAFAVFFGGSIKDGVIAALLATLPFITDLKLKKYSINPIIYNFICTFLLGIIAYLISLTGIIDDLDTVILGLVMIYIPGVQFTNAIRDMLCGDIISGLLRMIEAIILAVSIAIGFASAILAGNLIF